MRRLLLLVLVATLSEAVPGIPIYCRRFKGNCKRSNNLCCKYLKDSSSDSSTTIATTSTTTTTTTPAYEEEYVDELEASDGDPLDAQPSYVEEVFVKPTLEELNLVSAPEETSPAPGPSQYAPRFCSILKFNCATRSGHPCCKNPLQPDVSARRSSSGLLRPNSFSPPARKREEEPLKKEPLTEEEEPIEETEGESEESETAPAVEPERKESKSKLSKPAKSKYSSRSKNRSLFGKKSYRAKTTRRPKPVKASPATTASTTAAPIKKKPIGGGIKGKIKSSFFNRRPSGFDPSKSALCRIVNCGRTPQHKCCVRKEEAIEPQAVEVTTTTKTPETPETTPEPSTFDVTPPVSNGQPAEEIGKDVTEGLATTTTTPELRKTETNATVEETTEQNEEVTGGEEDQEEDTTTSMYGMYSMGEETTTLRDDEVVSESVGGEPDDSGHGQVDDEDEENEERAEENEERAKEDEGSGETAVTTGSPVEGSGKEETHTESGLESGGTLAPLEIMHEPNTEAPGGTDSPQELTTLPPGGISEGAETLQSFLATYTTSPPTVVTTRVIAPVYIPPWAQAKADQERKEGRLTPAAMVYQDIEEAVQPIEVIASNDLEQVNEERKEVEVEVEVDPEMEAEGWQDCRQFDCLLSPDHPCCEPHRSDKRHIDEGDEGESWRDGSGPKVTVLSLPGFNSLVAPLVLQYPGRVTATVTRVEKSYSWSPWRRL